MYKERERDREREREMVYVCVYVKVYIYITFIYIYIYIYMHRSPMNFYSWTQEYKKTSSLRTLDAVCRPCQKL